MAILQSAHDEYASIISTRRIELGLKKSVPSASDELYEIGDHAYVWHETPKMWTAPWTVRKVSIENRWVKVESKPAKPFSVAERKKAIDGPSVY